MHPYVHDVRVCECMYPYVSLHIPICMYQMYVYDYTSMYVDGCISMYMHACMYACICSAKWLAVLGRVEWLKYIKIY